MANEISPVQFPRGGFLQNARYIGPDGSLSIDKDSKLLHIHDGETPGGYPYPAFPEVGEDGVVSLRAKGRWVNGDDIQIDQGSLMETLVIPDEVIQFRHESANGMWMGTYNLATMSLLAEKRVGFGTAIYGKTSDGKLIVKEVGLTQPYVFWDIWFQAVDEWTPPADASVIHDVMETSTGALAAFIEKADATTHFVIFSLEGTVSVEVPITTPGAYRTMVEKTDGNFYLTIESELLLVNIVTPGFSVHTSVGSAMYLFNGRVSDAIYAVVRAAPNYIAKYDQNMTEVARTNLVTATLWGTGHTPGDYFGFFNNTTRRLTIYDPALNIVFDGSYTGTGSSTRSQGIVGTTLGFVIHTKYQYGFILIDPTDGSEIVPITEYRNDDVYNLTAFYDKALVPGDI